MATLLLRFAINLEDYHSPFRNHGPLFHRWLPDGEKDAITFDTGEPDTELKIWFERRGYVNDGGFIEFDADRRDVDDSKIPTQAVLDAGPLFGSLKIENLSKKYVVPMTENRLGDEDYINLGKKIVKLLRPPIARFLDTLRTNYGQHWVSPLKEWDSRSESVGSYCSGLQIDWSLDGGESWEKFRPDENIFYINALYKDPEFDPYLTAEDWNDVAEIVQIGYEPSLAATILTRSRQLSEQGNANYALIEGVTALELAIGDFVRNKVGDSDILKKSIQSFWNLPLPSKVVSLVTTLGADPRDLEDTISAIDLRNAIVHEGKSPGAIELSGLYRTISLFIKDGPSLRFPESVPSNALKSPKEWEAYYKAQRSHSPNT